MHDRLDIAPIPHPPSPILNRLQGRLDFSLVSSSTSALFSISNLEPLHNRTIAQGYKARASPLEFCFWIHTLHTGSSEAILDLTAVSYRATKSSTYHRRLAFPIHFLCHRHTTRPSAYQCSACTQTLHIIKSETQPHFTLAIRSAFKPFRTRSPGPLTTQALEQNKI